jgi:hypothetical protein
MNAKLTPADQVEVGELYKYIRLDTGEIRFARIYGLGPAHSDMIEEDDDEEATETVVSAGMIAVCGDYWEYKGFGSHTCKAPWLPKDTNLITQLIARRCL